MRAGELHNSGEVWKFTPSRHKGAWRNKHRGIYIGPEAVAVLRPLLAGLGPEEFVFSPKRSEAAHHAARSAARKTPRWPSHLQRNVRKRRGSRARDTYDTNSAGRALKSACGKAGVTPFILYELRHLRGAELVELGNVKLARAALGHSHAAMTGHYTRAADAGLAERAARIRPNPTKARSPVDGPSAAEISPTQNKRQQGPG
jgi:integrase